VSCLKGRKEERDSESKPNKRSRNSEEKKGGVRTMPWGELACKVQRKIVRNRLRVQKTTARDEMSYTIYIKVHKRV